MLFSFALPPTSADQKNLPPENQACVSILPAQVETLECLDKQFLQPFSRMFLNEFLQPQLPCQQNG